MKKRKTSSLFRIPKASKRSHWFGRSGESRRSNPNTSMFAGAPIWRLKKPAAQNLLAFPTRAVMPGERIPGKDPAPPAGVHQEVNASGNAEIRNSHCSVRFDARVPEITIHDYDDKMNYPAEYTTTKRNVKKAWDYIVKHFTPATRFSEVDRMIDAFKIRVHYWCTMD